jgi:hypothetical protein
VASLAGRFGRSGGGFSWATVSSRLGPVACVLEGAGQRWHRVERATPCRLGCGVVQGLMHACQNTAHALGAPGGSMVSGWQGRGAVHGRSGAGAARGIDHGSRRGASVEVTAQGGVGAMLHKLEVHGGHDDVLGKGGVAGCAAAVWGRGEWSARTAIADRGLAEGGGVEEKEREGGSGRATASGSSSPSSSTGK